MKNPMGKARTVEHPYLTVEAGGWTWKVLKAYTADPNKPGARWLCAVTSPMTQGSTDMGDTYTANIEGIVTQRDESVPDEALPRHLLTGEAAPPDIMAQLGF